MDSLNEYQKKAVTFEGKHLLVLAGAGTGKTKTIIGRAKYLINQKNVQPNKIAILSFTRKSAKEIAERLKIAVNQNINKDQITGKTFHSWCYEIMHLYPKLFPHHTYTPLDEDDRLSVMALALGKNFKDSKNIKVKKETVTEIYSYTINTQCKLSDAIFHVRYANLDPNDENIKKYVEEDRALIAPVIQKYMQYKKEHKYLDYDDILNIVADTLLKNPQACKIITSRYQHILVDEFQDTNPLQYKLLKSFINDSHLFCVGDDAQSIYAFRGADFTTIHRFDSIFPDSKIQKLLLNYRSTQEILDVSNWVLEQSSLNYDKKLEAFRGSGQKPFLIHVDDDWQEADIITDNIIKSVNQGDTYSENMVLGRSLWSLSKVEGSCLTKRIPYVKLGGISIMQSAHVRDVASALRIVANNYDEIAWIRFLQLFDGIGEVKASKIIAHLVEYENFEDMINYLKNSKIKEVTSQMYDTLLTVNDYQNRPARAMKTALEQMETILAKKYKEDWQKRQVDFKVLEEVASATGSITEFISEYVLDPKAETTFKIGKEKVNDMVILSTIHSAKGLESKNVHLVNVNPFSYPSVQTIKQGKEAIEEERRCLYVGLTRAKDNLYVYRYTQSLHTQFDDENEEKSQNLYFLNGIPEDFFEIKFCGQVMPDFPEGDIYSQNQDFDFPDFDFD